MKKQILVLALSVMIMGTITTSCSSSSEKVEAAKENVDQANKDLDSANKDYLVDIENYRKEKSEIIAANDKSIEEFRLRIKNEKQDARADYQKKIAELDGKNSDMKLKIENYKADGKDKWTKFKDEFSHDMDELGQAFKDLTVKNVK